MDSRRYTVMIVDDHAVVRAGLRSLLEVSGLFQVVAEAGCVAEAVTGAAKSLPDLVMMDVRLPDGSGIEACRQIRQQHPGTRVVMLTSYTGEEAEVAALIAGASGYLLKEVSEETILHALKIVAQGGMLMTPDVVARALSGRRSGIRPGLADLTDQERRILELIADGKTNREIGEVLFLSEHTVRNYVSRILERLGLHNRSEAAAFVTRHRI